MNKPSILKTVSISEMLHLRDEEGLSNQEIAKRIGCFYNTVNRHIGPAPFKKFAKKRVPSALPATTVVPECPKESFKERCERMFGACEPATHPLTDNRSKRIDDELVYTMRPEKLAKYAEESSLPAEQHKLPAPPLLSDRIDELVSVFGKMVVIEYIRCRLYEIGMNEDAMVIDRDGLLAKLNELQGGERLD